MWLVVCRSWLGLCPFVGIPFHLPSHIRRPSTRLPVCQSVKTLSPIDPLNASEGEREKKGPFGFCTNVKAPCRHMPGSAGVSIKMKKTGATSSAPPMSKRAANERGWMGVGYPPTSSKCPCYTCSSDCVTIFVCESVRPQEGRPGYQVIWVEPSPSHLPYNRKFCPTFPSLTPIPFTDNPHRDTVGSEIRLRIGLGGRINVVRIVGVGSSLSSPKKKKKERKEPSVTHVMRDTTRCNKD
ncbi:hypothetical protein LZ31DRAFT_380887 [Colletotrichum somersetense]|nr:hypothetical protein LZ31DRAFT_380887 [Colletotrichum somersetense]